MGKISLEGKKKYFEKVKEYKHHIEMIIQREKNLIEVLQKEDAGGEYKRITLAEENLNLVSFFILLNDLSVTLLGVKNEAFLNDARKCCYKAIIYLEEVVSPLIDSPFSEYEQRLLRIEGLEDEKRFALIRKLGFSIDAVEEGFGDNSKWRWSFVELEGRFAAVTKNMLNLKRVAADHDPNSDGYESRVGHLALVKKLLRQSADRYRERYELTALRIDDFKKAIHFLSSLRRINLVLGQTTEAEIIKKKVEIWSTKMEADEKKLEQKTLEQRTLEQRTLEQRTRDAKLQQTRPG